MNRPQDEAIGPIELTVFLAELVLIAGLAVAGARLGDGALSVALAVLVPLGAAVLWAWCLAPRAARRLQFPARLGVKFGLVVVASALLAFSGQPLWGALLLVSIGTVFVSGELRERALTAHR